MSESSGLSLRVGPAEDEFPSLSEALAVPEATEIVLTPGTYVEHVVIEPRRAPLLVRSATGEAADVVLSFGLRQGDLNPGGTHWGQDCASLTIDADDVVLRELTIENTFDREEHPGLPDSQALALRTRGDRIRIERCRLLGRQDTVLLDTPTRGAVRHVELTDCEIHGDVDFVYGRATAVISGGVVHSTGPGYVAAPSTIRENPRGFLFSDVTFTAAEAVPAGSVRLARPWHQGGSPEALGSVEFVNCTFGEHIHADRWADMGGFAWQDARFVEYVEALSTDPVRATPTKVLAESAPTPASWLRGWDGTPAATGHIVVVSDSTASDYPEDRYPRTGWGQVLPEVAEVTVDNHAVSGASTRSFIESGALDGALDALSPGDTLVIAFGHNDPKADHRHTDLFTLYTTNLRRFLVGARARGARPVLATSVERRGARDPQVVTMHGGYPQAVRTLAREEGVELIDLGLLSRRLWRGLGEEESKGAFQWLAPGQWPNYPEGVEDNTHFSHEGALMVARLVGSELEKLGLTKKELASV